MAVCDFDASLIISKLHSCLLRRSASCTGKHYQGFVIVFRDRSLALSNPLKRKLSHMDDAFNLIRHITSVSAQQLEDGIVVELSLPMAHVTYGGIRAGSTESVAAASVDSRTAQQAHLTHLFLDSQGQISQMSPDQQAQAAPIYS